MEIQGTVFKATTELSKSGKDIFKIGIRLDDGSKDWELSVFDAQMIANIILLKGKHVSAVVEKGEKYWNLLGIKESGISSHRAEKLPQPKPADWDMIGRQKARCSLVQSACQHLSASGQAKPETIIEYAKKFESYVFSPMPLNDATSPTVARKPIPEGIFPKGDSTPTTAQSTAKADFVEACVKAGYSVQTKQGQAGIKAWMAKAGKTNLPFDELSEDKQAELIHMMRAEELAE